MGGGGGVRGTVADNEKRAKEPKTHPRSTSPTPSNVRLLTGH